MADTQNQKAIGYFAINLDGADARWQSVSQSAIAAGLHLTRIPAVDGRTIEQSAWTDFDVARFRRCHGKWPHPGEYGCYKSHLKALNVFLQSAHTSAVILEDDAVLNDKLQLFCKALENQYGGEAMLVRLSSHRQPLFEPLKDVTGITVGQCWFGPTGSSAAYWISRAGAKKLVETLAPGFLPVDAALERSWATGVPAFMVKPDLVKRLPVASQITTRAGSAKAKPPFYKRIGALGFRTSQFVARLLSCVSTRHLQGVAHRAT